LPDRAAVVAAAGHGATSTLYHLVGPTAGSSLLVQLAVDARDVRATQPYRDVVGNLTAEAKVWSFWHRRAGWLDELEHAEQPDRVAAAESLVGVLAGWAAAEPRLAAVVRHEPPVAAVEDLCVVGRGRFPAVTAHDLLTRVVALALEPGGTSTGGVLDAVHGDLVPLFAADRPAPDDPAAYAADLVTELRRVGPDLAADARASLLGAVTEALCAP
jgi:hypothetical protein